MRILITGSGGFVATHAAAEMHAVGAEVYATGRFEPPGNDRHLPWRTADLSVTGAWDDLLAWARPEAILHLAAQSSPRDSWQALRETFDGNLSPILELISALKRRADPVRILYVSSSDVYGFPDESELPLTEESPLRPANPYAVSKHAAEQCLRMVAEQEKLDVVIARPFSHTGPGQDTRFVVPAFAREVALVEAGRKDSITHGNLESWRDFSDVRDVVRAYRLLIEQGKSGETYNVSFGESVRIGDILTALSRMANVEALRAADNHRLRPESPVRVCGCSAKIASHTGWKPNIRLEQTLADVLAQQREQVATLPRESSP